MAPRGSGRDYGNKGFRKGIEVIDLLLMGDILEWKSLDEVATKTGLSRNEAYAALNTLVDKNWAEKSDRGFRACPAALTRINMAAQECLMGYAQKLGLK